MNLKRARIYVAIIFVILVMVMGGGLYWIFKIASSDKGFLRTCDNLVTDVSKDVDISADEAYVPCKESWEHTKNPKYGYNFYRVKRIRDEEVDMELLKEVSEKDYGPAQFAYAGHFRENATTPDFEQAFYWYKRAADNGIAEAQVNIGWAYANGKGVAKNDVLATEWYKKAVDSGSTAGLYNLAWMYQNRRGTQGISDQDLDKKAVDMYRLAIERGFGFAQLNLCNMYKGDRVADIIPQEKEKCQ